MAEGRERTPREVMAARMAEARADVTRRRLERAEQREQQRAARREAAAAQQAKLEQAKRKPRKPRARAAPHDDAVRQTSQTSSSTRTAEAGHAPVGAVHAPIDLGFSPHRYQRELIQALARHRFGVAVTHRRWGKALDVETKIPLANGGWKSLADVAAGDELIGSDGRPVKVMCAHPVMLERPCYEVRFGSGAAVIADAEHLWVTTRKCDRHRWIGRQDRKRKIDWRRNVPRSASLRTTEEIAASLKSRGEFNHRVRLCEPVEYAEQDLPIDPYLLGQWLGDGTTSSSEITTADSETVERLGAICARYGWSLIDRKTKTTGKASTYRINGGLQRELRRCGLLGNKHIPESYLRASIRQRMELLHGLMDSDGAITPAGHFCEIIQKHTRLADGVVALLRSLGMVPRVCKKMAMGNEYQRIKFRPMLQVFSLPRKAKRYTPPPERLHWQSIIGCSPVPSRPVRCLTVDAADGQFCVGEHYTLTHNTRLAVQLLVHRVLTSTRSSPRCGYVAPLLSQAKQSAWMYLTEVARRIPGHRILEAELTVELPRDRRIKLYGGSQGNEEAIRGIYLDGCVIDEYADVAPHLLDQIIMPTLADREGWLLVLGTPKGMDAFSELYHVLAPARGWHRAVYRVDETAGGISWLSEQEIAEMRRNSSPLAWAQEWLCDFGAAAEDAWIPMTLISEASAREYNLHEVKYAPVVLGVDVARYGNDRSVLQLRQGLWARTPQVYEQVDNMHLAGLVAEAITREHVQATFIDAGRGEGVIDRLRQLGHRGIHEINFGGKATNERYADKRTEMWAALKTWLEQGGALPQHSALKTDLAGPRYGFGAAGKLKLESKETMRDRGLRSSDLGDALALTFAMPVASPDRAQIAGRRYQQRQRVALM